MLLVEEKLRESLERIVHAMERYVEFKVLVKAEAVEEKLVLEAGELVFYTREPNVSQRPLAALRRMLLGVLRVHHKDIELERSRRGESIIVRVRGLGPEEVVKRLMDAVEVG